MAFVQLQRWTTCCLVLICVGCSDQLNVHGKVSFPDGSPVTSGRVVFVSDSQTAMSSIKLDGSYSIDTIPKNQTGTYRVYLEGGGVVTIDPAGKSKPRIQHIDPKFLSADSGILCDVKGNTKFDFQVEKGKTINPFEN